MQNELVKSMFLPRAGTTSGEPKLTHGVPILGKRFFAKHKRGVFVALGIVIFIFVTAIAAVVAWAADEATGGITINDQGYMEFPGMEGEPSIMDNLLSGPLRGACNWCLEIANNFIVNTGNLEYLTQSFSDIFPTIEPMIHQIYNTIALPTGNVVLVVFLVVGLCRAVSNMGKSDAGYDLWQILVVFIVYAFMVTILNSSYHLMVGLFNVSRDLIQSVVSVGVNSGVMNVQLIGESATDVGFLLAALIICFLTMIVSFIIFAITYGVMIIRCIQCYVYTTFAAVPLAFFVSESGRSVATGFCKRYLALLFSGVIMVLLMLMYSSIISSFSAFITAGAASADQGITYITALVAPMITSIVFAWSMLRSGQWANDFFGV